MDTNINHHTSLFVGEPIEDPGEQALISRLRADLDRLGVRAVLYANFIASGQDQRQIDLLVRTEQRVAHVEIKSLAPDLPLRAALNGPWRQVLPDGSERAFDKNFGRQAVNGTYAIGDWIRKLAKRNAVPTVGYVPKLIDTVLCVWEHVPAGSEIESRDHLTVCGYAQLLERLQHDGPTLPWTDDDWDGFTRAANLFVVDTASAEERERLASLAAVEEYRARLLASLDLIDLVDVPVTWAAGADAASTTGVMLASAVANGQVVALVGESGAGKTFHARHVVREHTIEGRLVIFARCGDYGGTLRTLLARSTAAYSAKRWNELVNRAEAAGVGVTLVLDALNDCPERLRAQLLEQANAFHLRHAGGVLVTSTEAIEASSPLRLRTARLQRPNRDNRRDILEVHGARDPERLRDSFATPYELSIAAQCEAALPERATRVDLLDAYVRRFATERHRAGIRELAWAMHREIAPSVPIVDATASLARSGVDADGIDALLSSALVLVSGSRVRLAHDTLHQFLAADAVVAGAESGTSLGSTLSAPANEPIRELALGLERDHDRRWAAMAVLADARWYFRALEGVFGDDAARDAARRAREVLRAATASTVAGHPTVVGEGFEACWQNAPQLTAETPSVLRAVGMAMARGWWADEVAELLDATDRVCQSAAAQLAEAGSRAAITTVVQATYAPFIRPGNVLPASMLATASHGMFIERFNGRSCAGQLLDGAEDNSWGRFYLAALVVDPTASGDARLLVPLLRDAWVAQGYHLRLEVLQALQQFASSVPPEIGAAVVDAINDLPHTDNPLLGSTIVETLAAYGALVTTTTVAEIQQSMRELLRCPPTPETASLALSAVSRQFEPEDIVGPYSEAIAELPAAERVELLCLAAQAEDTYMTLSMSWVIGQLGKVLADRAHVERVRPVLERFLAPPDVDGFMPSDAIETWWAAVWAWGHAGLPCPEFPAPTPEERVWVALGHVLHELSQGRAGVWPAALADDPARTAGALSALRWAPDMWGGPRPRALALLVDHARPHVASLLEWAARHPTDVVVASRALADGLMPFVLSTLGQVGTLDSIAVVDVYVTDPELGTTAAQAIRQIRDRCDASKQP